MHTTMSKVFLMDNITYMLPYFCIRILQ